mmetsp:Transcript_74303/g.177036  ORF Transcript_74303/g.177036 Transcript_74303/m.177036 type:complete len:171 (-) Transcript_74303:327-839(-)
MGAPEDPNWAENICFIPQKSLDKFSAKLKKKEGIEREWLNDMVRPDGDGLVDNDVVVPTDLRGISLDYEKYENDFEKMLDDLGADGVAQGLLKARDYWLMNKSGEAAGKRASEKITAKKWREMCSEEHGDDDDEEEDDDDNDEEPEEEEGEEENEDDEAAQGPPAKKAKK